MWWTTGVAYDTAKVDGALDSWDALWDPQYSGKLAMLDDYREVFSAALFRLGFDINTTDDAQLDQALALLQQQKPLLRTYSTDDIGVLSSGDAWIMHAWGADVYQVQEERDTVTYYLPKEGGVRGSDTMVLLAGAQHPVAAHLFMNFMLDAAGRGRQHELHRLHGPQRGRQAVHRPGHPRGPDGEPGQGHDRQRSPRSSTSATDEVKYQDRWATLRAGA